MASLDRLIQNLFLSQLPRLQRQRHPLKNLKAIDAISQCRTRALGMTYFRCKDQHAPIEQLHSCRHRSCFLCASARRQRWIEQQKQRLFNCPHFHVIFTLPHEYLNLWRYNEVWFTRALFQTSKESVLTLLGDEQRRGFRPGILSALHTWGRQLNLHPHVHCLVTAGGLNRRGDWQSSGEFLLPIKQLKALYRGKFQARLQQAFEDGELVLPPDMSADDFQRLFKVAYRKEWSLRIEERYEHGKGVLLYLARYLKGGPLNPAQIQHCDAEQASFKYKDHRDGKVKTLSLSLTELTRRLLDHVPAIGVHTVRYYGLYASSAKGARERCVARLGNLQGVDDARGIRVADMVLFCKTCGAIARRTHSLWPGERKGNSLIRRRATGFLQQDDESGITNDLRAKVLDYDSS